MPRWGQLEPPICGAVGRPRSTAVGSVLDALGTGSAPLSEWKKKTVSLFQPGQGGQAESRLAVYGTEAAKRGQR